LTEIVVAAVSFDVSPTNARADWIVTVLSAGSELCGRAVSC